MGEGSGGGDRMRRMNGKSTRDENPIINVLSMTKIMIRSDLVEDVPDVRLGLAEPHSQQLGALGEGLGAGYLQLTLILMKLAWHSLAMALARRVLPHPGGPGGGRRDSLRGKNGNQEKKERKRNLP